MQCGATNPTTTAPASDDRGTVASDATSTSVRRVRTTWTPYV